MTEPQNKPQTELGNVLVIWKGTGGAGSSTLAQALRDTVGRSGQVTTLHIDRPGASTAAFCEATFPTSIIEAAVALAPYNDLVVIEIEGAATLPDETNPRLHGIAALTRSGAAAALVMDVSSHSLSVGLSRLATLTTACSADPTRLAAVVNRVTDTGALLRIEEHLVNIGVPNVHCAGLENPRLARRRTDAAPVGSNMRGVAYDILSDMNLSCLAVDDATFSPLLHDTAASKRRKRIA